MVISILDKMAKNGYHFSEPEIGLRKTFHSLYPKGGTLWKVSRHLYPKGETLRKASRRLRRRGAKSSSFFLQRKQLTMNFEFKILVFT